MKELRFFLLVGCVTFLSPFFLLVSAVSGYDEGTSTITISFDFSIGNDTNIVEYQEEIDDWFYTIIPKFVVSIPREQSDFSLAYSLRYDDYITETDFKNLSQNIDFISRIDLGDRLTFVLTDKFVDSLYGIWRDETDSISGSEYFVNTLSPELKYVSYSGAFTVDLSYVYMQEKWDVVSANDWEINQVTAAMSITPGLNLSLGVFGTFTQKDYRDIMFDYTSSYIGVHMSYKISRIADISLSIGLNSRDYKGQEDPDDQIRWNLSLDRVFTEITSFKFSLFHRYYDSEVFLGDFYTNSGIGLDYSNEILNDRLQLFLKGQYLLNKYQNLGNQELKSDAERAREDRLFRVYAGVGLKLLDWIALQFFYGYSIRDSNLDQFDIEDSRYELHLKFTRKLHFEF
ncbi:hypothetical protein ACFL27_18680 [candidate division CSSED10-310 bacterium]|uniref:Uncharacterized protein n=1 Tax=candidate division CSSED10-310 bacterium TaxID=2855610 RepID=A0ABV6Z1M5_UNCC1